MVMTVTPSRIEYLQNGGIHVIKLVASDGFFSNFEPITIKIVTNLPK